MTAEKADDVMTFRIPLQCCWFVQALIHQSHIDIIWKTFTIGPPGKSVVAMKWMLRLQLMSKA